jgi:hypothetical protein
MKAETRMLFTEVYKYGIYLAWIVGIFIGIHIQRIYYYSPPGVTEVPSGLLIASHTHILLMTILLFFLNREFRSTIKTRYWPHYWTEGLLIFALAGAFLTSLEYYISDAALYGNQLELFSYLDLMTYGGVSWGSAIYALGRMGFVVCAIIARTMEGE